MITPQDQSFLDHAGRDSVTGLIAAGIRLRELESEVKMLSRALGNIMNRLHNLERQHDDLR